MFGGFAMCGQARLPDGARASTPREIDMRPSDHVICIRPALVRSRSCANSKRFVNEVLGATEKAGGVSHRSAASSHLGFFGRGRPAALRALSGLHARIWLVTVKARFVRHSTST